MDLADFRDFETEFEARAFAAALADAIVLSPKSPRPRFQPGGRESAFRAATEKTHDWAELSK
jgi:hypothetical protein